MDPYPSNSTKDIYNITVQDYNITSPLDSYTEEIRLLLPSGIATPLSIEAGDEIKLCNKKSCQVEYRAKTRALLTKVPGFYFSAYSSVRHNLMALTSMDDLK